MPDLVEKIPVSDEYDLPGNAIEFAELALPKAIELASIVSSPDAEYVSLAGCRRTANNEIVVVIVEPEVPQHPVNDICRREIIAVEFDHEDKKQPCVTAIRRTFPRVIHTNVGIKNTPVDICLFDRPYSEQKLTWTAGGFVQQLHRWLSKTARGELHDPDQPLEQLFIGSLVRLILPKSCYGTDCKPLVVRRVSEHNLETVLTADDAYDPVDKKATPTFALISYFAGSRQHGAIEFQPLTLNELADYLGDEGASFLNHIGKQLIEIQDSKTIGLDAPLIIVIHFPIARSNGSAPERLDTWAFGTGESLSKVGASIGIWGDQESTRGGVLLGRDTTKTGDGVSLFLMTPSSVLDREDSARHNGTKVSNCKYFAVGAGALGSHVIGQLVRMGHGHWTIVDNDFMMPHNMARHYLNRYATGYSKALALSSELNSLFDEATTDFKVLDVVEAIDGDTNTLMEKSDAIVDLSASVAVSRHLAIDVNSSARRIACFMSPSGQDSVFLAESNDRAQRLDLIEMDYYRALLNNPLLDGHLDVPVKRDRYANACRDISARLPHDAVVNHSSLAARQIRVIEDASVAKVFRANEMLVTTQVEIALGGYHELKANGWSVFVSKLLLSDMEANRIAQLPNETGGVLIGVIDTSRRILYVVDQIPSPNDSVRSPTSYIRGSEGLIEKIDAIGRKTAGQLRYVGEWHSHPSESVSPSNDDRELFQWLANYLRTDGFPALMSIVGSRSSAWFLEVVENHRELVNE